MKNKTDKFNDFSTPELKFAEFLLIISKKIFKNWSRIRNKLINTLKFDEFLLIISLKSWNIE